MFKILLFQPHLRKHILNFGKNLTNFQFVTEKIQKSQDQKYRELPTFEKEVNRTKYTVFNKLRSVIGILNIRPIFRFNCDLLFSYGTLLITNKPYCTYIESGTAIFNYDPYLANNPIAKYVAGILISQSSCKRLIFMSNAAKLSFANYIPKVFLPIFEKKSITIYPLVEQYTTDFKKAGERVKFLFLGSFYMKGGMELVNTFRQLSQKYSDIYLTIVTQIQAMRPTDIRSIKRNPNINLLNSTLSENDLQNLFLSHDIFVLPTYRDSFGLVILEALSAGMPIIATDQYATREMVTDSKNGFVYPNHPLKDYNNKFKHLGFLRDPKDFYQALFSLQSHKGLKEVEKFLFQSMMAFITDPKLITEFSKESLRLYQEKFSARKISSQIESVFAEAISL